MLHSWQLIGFCLVIICIIYGLVLCVFNKCMWRIKIWKSFGFFLEKGSKIWNRLKKEHMTKNNWSNSKFWIKKSLRILSIKFNRFNLLQIAEHKIIFFLPPCTHLTFTKTLVRMPWEIFLVLMAFPQQLFHPRAYFLLLREVFSAILSS